MVIRAGTTMHQGLRGFGKSGAPSKNNIIHKAINRIDIRRTHNLIDKDAFIIEFDVNSIKGGKYTKFFSKEALKKLSNK
jgi:uncharacterized protein YebE (UPF0316 family)